jgi:hypothetical protein
MSKLSPYGPRHWLRRLTAALVVAGSITACGGGTSAIEVFIPERVLTFGDETSLILPDGMHYGINGLDANNAFDCRLQPVWTQLLVGIYGYVFAECNPTALTPHAFQRAALAAKVADLKTQIDDQVDNKGGFKAKDLATVLVGTYDIIEVYQQNPACDPNDRNSAPEASARGAEVARQVNRLIDLGAKVIVSTVPSVNLTPYGIAQNAADPTRGPLLKCLSDKFNARIRVDIRQDGRFVGLVLGDDAVQLAVNAPAANGLINVTQAACAVPLPDCTTDPIKLVSGATATNYLWADDTHLAPWAHASLGSQAATRARNNPF